MKNVFICLLLICIILFVSFTKGTGEVKMTSIKVQAPFDMPVINVPDFSKCRKFSITDFGAVQGDKAKTSAAIAKAIDEANKIGGGTVVIPEGEWLTGQVHLKSNVNLYLNKDATLLFSEKPEDYLPMVHSSWEGLECYNYSPLIYAYQCKNIAITGEGKVKAKMDIWKNWVTRPRGHMNSIKYLYNMAQDNVPVEKRQMVNDSAHLRPQFIQINRCENVLLENFLIQNSPFWTVHFYLSKDIVVRGINIKANGRNNDGIDPEMSQNILIENVTFDQGDDAVAIKSGRNPEGWRTKTPTKNFVMRNCTMKNGHQLVAMGSELSGGIENVFVDNCTVTPGAKMFNVAYIKTNERMGGYVKNIYIQNIQGCRMDSSVFSIETDVLYQWKKLVPTVERRLTPIQNIHLTNIKATSAKHISKIVGEKELPIKDVYLKNVVCDTLRKVTRHVHENLVNFREE